MQICKNPWKITAKPCCYYCCYLLLLLINVVAAAIVVAVVDDDDVCGENDDCKKFHGKIKIEDNKIDKC